MAPSPEPFRLSIPETALADLKARLAMTRFPDQAPDGPWAYGTDLEYMRGLVGDWKDSFDWRGQEAALNAYPQFKVKLHAISALPGCSVGRQCASPKAGFRRPEMA